MGKKIQRRPYGLSYDGTKSYRSQKLQNKKVAKRSNGRSQGKFLEFAEKARVRRKKLVLQTNWEERVLQILEQQKLEKEEIAIILRLMKNTPSPSSNNEGDKKIVEFMGLLKQPAAKAAVWIFYNYLRNTMKHRHYLWKMWALNLQYLPLIANIVSSVWKYKEDQSVSLGFLMRMMEVFFQWLHYCEISHILIISS